MSDLNRRDFLTRAAASAVLASLVPGRLLAAPRRRLLCFTKSSGFQHGPVKRPADGSFSLVERVLKEQGAKHGFDNPMRVERYHPEACGAGRATTLRFLLDQLGQGKTNAEPS